MIDGPLAAFCADAFLLARYGGPEDGRPDGRAWERAVSAGLWIDGVSRRQHAGTFGLFGRGGRSGALHEIDGAGHGPALGIWLEAKARDTVDKSDVAVFAFKVLDLYREFAAADPAAVGAGRWWPVLVSSEPCGEAVRRCAIAMGIVVCDPELAPLPLLLAAAARPVGGLSASGALLAHAAALGARCCRPIQARWSLDARRRTLSLSLDEPGARAIGQMLTAQCQLTADLLDHWDENAPGAIERRGAVLRDRLRASARAW